ncbi:MAG: response regulator [Pyrinomonadaceae bacterium]
MSFHTRTIMVVDDDDDLRSMVEGLLRRAGYVVVGVASGYEAHSLALKTLPALIIMDIGMPGMDGLTTVWKMRKHDELATVPVIIMTAYESYDLRGEAASAGCHKYLTKPFEPAELKALVNQILSLDQPA